MYGYIYLTTNTANGKKYIGKYESVKFDKNHLGDVNPLLVDIEKYGRGVFSVQMLMPYESKKALDAAEKEYLKEYDALNDTTFYNAENAAPKKSRKKAVIVEDVIDE